MKVLSSQAEVFHDQEASRRASLQQTATHMRRPRREKFETPEWSSFTLRFRQLVGDLHDDVYRDLDQLEYGQEAVRGR